MGRLNHASSFALCAMLGLLGSSCSLPLDSAQRVPTFPIFDPEAGEIPMPNDALRDESTGTLDLPLDDDSLSPADRSFREWLNTRDGWSTTLPATGIGLDKNAIAPGMNRSSISRTAVSCAG